MNKNKILVELSVPSIEKSYDIFIPINKKVGTMKSLIEEALVDLTGNAYIIKKDTNLYSQETGQIYNVNTSIKDTDLKNGSKIILI